MLFLNRHDLKTLTARVTTILLMRASLRSYDHTLDGNDLIVYPGPCSSQATSEFSHPWNGMHDRLSTPVSSSQIEVWNIIEQSDFLLLLLPKALQIERS